MRPIPTPDLKRERPLNLPIAKQSIQCKMRYPEERKIKHTQLMMLMQTMMLVMAITPLTIASLNSSTPSQPISLSSSKTQNNTHQGLELNSIGMVFPS